MHFKLMAGRNRHASRLSAAGFTLIELLVAISILAIIAVLGWRGLDSIVRARVLLTAEMEQTRGMQLAFAQLENDCAHLVDATNFPGREVLSAVGARLVLVRNVFEENQPTRLQVVVYSSAVKCCLPENWPCLIRIGKTLWRMLRLAPPSHCKAR